jgi:hypothetical protein
MSVSVRRREETELLAGLKISALPAPLKVVLPATIPDLALRWPAIVAAPAFTPKLHHRPKDLVTRLIVGEWLEERGKPWSHPLKMILAQLLTQIARQISNLSRVIRTAAMKATVRYRAYVGFIHAQSSTFSVSIRALPIL